MEVNIEPSEVLNKYKHSIGAKAKEEKAKTNVNLSRSNYDLVIPRKLVASITDTSVTTLANYEQEDIIKAYNINRGKLKIVGYTISDIQKIFKLRNYNFKKKEEAEVISVFSQKGGVGKSAFTQHLASILSLVGKVLVIDLDSQSDITTLLGQVNESTELITEDELDPTIAELMDWTLADDDTELYDKFGPEEVIKEIGSTIDLIPSDLDLGQINYSMNRFKLKPRVSKDGKIEAAELYMIKEVIDKIKHKYDYILIDCPPNIETCNLSALFASNRILIPLELEAKTLTIMRRNIHFLESIAEANPGFNWDNILVVPNKYKRENIKKKAQIAIEEHAGESDSYQLSSVIMPNSAIIDKLSAARLPVYALTNKYLTNIKAQESQAKEFTNYFWVIAHELLELDCDRLIFQDKL